LKKAQFTPPLLVHRSLHPPVGHHHLAPCRADLFHKVTLELTDRERRHTRLRTAAAHLSDGTTLSPMTSTFATATMRRQRRLLPAHSSSTSTTMMSHTRPLLFSCELPSPFSFPSLLLSLLLHMGGMTHGGGRWCTRWWWPDDGNGGRGSRLGISSPVMVMMAANCRVVI
jgi:hypothetical protein